MAQISPREGLQKTLLTLLALALLALATSVVAEGPSVERGANDDRVVDREHLRIDHEAVAAMSWDERREYMQAYKRAREIDALRSGDYPGQGGYVPLDTPRPVADPANVRVFSSNITYDSGVVTGISGIPSQMVGNRFDSAVAAGGTTCCFPVEMSGTVTMITFDMVNTFFGSAVWSLYSNQVGTAVDQVTSKARPGVVTGLNTFNVSSPATVNTYQNGTFFAGIWQFDPTMTGLGVDTATTGGQGFHGISLNDGAMGTGLTTITTGGGGGLNAVFRVSGNVATPVELMSFEIEETVESND